MVKKGKIVKKKVEFNGKIMDAVDIEASYKAFLAENKDDMVNIYQQAYDKTKDTRLC